MNGKIKLRPLPEIHSGLQVLYHRGAGIILPNCGVTTCIVECDDGTPSHCTTEMLEELVVEYDEPEAETGTNQVLIDYKAWKEIVENGWIGKDVEFILFTKSFSKIPVKAIITKIVD